MKQKTLIVALAAAFALIAVSMADAGGVTITPSSQTVAVGDTASVEICGLGGRTAEFRITAPDASQQTGQVYAPNCGTINFVADQAGTYTFEVLNKSGKNVLASATVTAA